MSHDLPSSDDISGDEKERVRALLTLLSQMAMAFGVHLNRTWKSGFSLS